MLLAGRPLRRRSASGDPVDGQFWLCADSCSLDAWLLTEGARLDALEAGRDPCQKRRRPEGRPSLIEGRPRCVESCLDWPCMGVLGLPARVFKASADQNTAVARLKCSSGV